ncbi:MAG: Na/Pi cotransporter family protein [Oscillospiraceae bacterium]|nr:Na/Pi cotransporter family protein [Oscillospiraceae bacterium]
MFAFNIISMIGGVALFLYGMSVMGGALEKLASGKTEKVLRRLTSSPWRGALLGLIITAIIQSSSATTVIVVGLVNSGIMQFSQAVGIVMGANIGTTVTAQILRLSDISGDSVLLNIFKPTTLGPVAATIGIILFMFRRDQRSKTIGQILLGFGVLFTGMRLMEQSVGPLSDSDLFRTLFTTLKNPLIGILVGALVTGIIQSSSASVGILQALTVTGAIQWGNAIPIILGQNIGTCVTALLASIGGSRAGRRVSIAHLLFNIIGSGICIVIMLIIQGSADLAFWDKTINMGDIANFHTVFNVGTTLILLPANKLLIKLTQLIVPDKYVDPHPELTPVVLDELLLLVPATALSQARNAVAQMAEISKLLTENALKVMLTNDQELLMLAVQRESTLDKLEVAVGNYLVKIAQCELSDAESRDVTTLLSYVSDFERIGDYATNIVERAGEVFDKKIVFSDSATQEIYTLNKAATEVIELTIAAFENSDLNYAYKVEPLEETIDSICDELRTRHVERLKNGDCRIESGIVFLEALINYERISDHCSNIAAKLISDRSISPDTHTLLSRMHEESDSEYLALEKLYQQKYSV